MLNMAAVQGRLAAEPELKHTPNNVAVCKFTVATETGYGDKKRSHFLDCVAWKNTAELICKYFKKGQEINIQGSLQTREYEDRSGNKRKVTEILVGSVSFCGPRQDVSPKRQEQPQDSFFDGLEDVEPPF